MQVFTISAAAFGMCQQRGSLEKQDIYHYSDIVLANEGVVAQTNGAGVEFGVLFGGVE